MSDGVIAALITGGFSVFAIFISAYVQSSSTKRLMEYQIKEIKEDISELADKVNKHNNLIERMAIVERDVKSAHKRIDDIKGEH